MAEIVGNMSQSLRNTYSGYDNDSRTFFKLILIPKPEWEVRIYTPCYAGVRCVLADARPKFKQMAFYKIWSFLLTALRLQTEGI